MKIYQIYFHFKIYFFSFVIQMNLHNFMYFNYFTKFNYSPIPSFFLIFLFHHHPHHFLLKYNLNRFHYNLYFINPNLLLLIHLLTGLPFQIICIFFPKRIIFYRFCFFIYFFLNLFLFFQKNQSHLLLI